MTSSRQQKSMATTQWLASVKSLSEAKTLIDCPPTLIDLKNPANGALGALETKAAAEIVAWVKHHNLPSQISATIGDLPMQADIIIPKLHAMAATGVDYLKIGLFKGDATLYEHEQRVASPLKQCLIDLTPIIQTLEIPVIGVLFADGYPVGFDLACLKQAGFHGAMVDTAIKNGRGLLDHWDTNKLTQFILDAHANTLICGLAGALRIEDIEKLKPLGTDYLGFRSALCQAQTRTGALDIKRVRQIQQSF